MNNQAIHLVQLRHPVNGRRIALVSASDLQLLDRFNTVYDLSMHAIEDGSPLREIIVNLVSEEKVNYDAVYDGVSDWKLLPSFDVPENPMACMISGTGLTHKNSALNRQMMHISAEDKPTDSMVMYQWGVEGGTPSDGEIGVQPEWFYKGNGTILKAHHEALNVPPYANNGGEEPELAGIYVIDKNGNPYRIGFSTGNEFSDHIMEKKNYLYLAPSKLRECAIGPELIIDSAFASFAGTVNVSRNGEILWQSAINSGSQNMAHNLQNLQYHHFKYAGHRVPYQAHVHFFGADAFSFGSGLLLEDGDMMSVQWENMGRALLNPLKISAQKEALIEIRSL